MGLDALLSWLAFGAGLAAVIRLAWLMFRLAIRVAEAVDEGDQD